MPCRTSSRSVPGLCHWYLNTSYSAGLCSSQCKIFLTRVLVHFSFFPFPHCHIQELNKAQKKVEEQAQRLKERQEQCTQLESTLKECKDKVMALEQRIEQLEGLNKVCILGVFL